MTSTQPTAAIPTEYFLIHPTRLGEMAAAGDAIAALEIERRRGNRSAALSIIKSNAAAYARAGVTVSKRGA